MLEYAARVILRRQRSNNFIFLTSRFDSIDEILVKYRISIPGFLEEKIDLFRQEWRRCDIVEFLLSDKDSRILQDIVVFEVKSKFKSVKRNYFEMCFSGARFFRRCQELNIDSYILSVVLLNNWFLAVNLLPFSKVSVRTYSNSR